MNPRYLFTRPCGRSWSVFKDGFELGFGFPTQLDAAQWLAEVSYAGL